MSKSDKCTGLLYLYNGGKQPEIWSVNSIDQAKQYAGGFLKARLEVPGQPSQDLTQPSVTKEFEVLEASYDWQKARGHLVGHRVEFAPDDTDDPFWG